MANHMMKLSADEQLIRTIFFELIQKHHNQPMRYTALRISDWAMFIGYYRFEKTFSLFNAVGWGFKTWIIHDRGGYSKTYGVEIADDDPKFVEFKLRMSDS
jgi:hypothetical protein